MKHRRNQSGVGTIEIILLVVVIGLIGFVGWYIWSNRAEQPETSSTTSKTQAVTESKKTEEKPATKPTTPTVSYFEIKELGVKFETNTELKNLYYTMGNNNKTAYFSLTDLKNTDCAADKTSQIALTRYTDADFEEDIQAQPQKSSAKKIDNYYYFVASGQANCSDDATTAQKAADMKTAVKKLLPANLVKK